MGALVFALALAVTPVANDAPPPEPLLVHAEAVQARKFLKQVEAARHLVLWVDTMNTPPTTTPEVERSEGARAEARPRGGGADTSARAVANDTGDCARAFAIPTEIVRRESGCSYTARNPSSSAGGAYQMIQSTADNAARAIGHPELVGSNASTWPPELQDQAAAHLWNGGAGCGHWAPTNGCG